MFAHWANLVFTVYALLPLVLLNSDKETIGIIGIKIYIHIFKCYIMLFRFHIYTKLTATAKLFQHPIDRDVYTYTQCNVILKPLFFFSENISLVMVNLSNTPIFFLPFLSSNHKDFNKNVRKTIICLQYFLMLNWVNDIVGQISDTRSCQAKAT